MPQNRGKIKQYLYFFFLKGDYSLLFEQGEKGLFLLYLFSVISPTTDIILETNNSELRFRLNMLFYTLLVIS